MMILRLLAMKRTLPAGARFFIFLIIFANFFFFASAFFFFFFLMSVSEKTITTNPPSFGIENFAILTIFLIVVIL